MGEVLLYQADAFSADAFGGNPAAVLLQTPDQAKAITDETRQKFANEMNLSETSFLEFVADDKNPSWQTSSHFNLRWFTPEKEVALCGHATLAAAAVLLQGEGNKSDSIHFQTRQSGELVVRNCPEGSEFKLAMDLPWEEPKQQAPSWAASNSALVQAILGPLQSEVREILFNERLRYLLIVLRDGTTRTTLEQFTPDIRAALQAADKSTILLAIVSTNGDDEHDFLSRVFCPWAGIDEDPVTGSAHAVMGPYWAKKLGKDKMTARQCSKRGGELGVEVLRDTQKVRVFGNAALISKGVAYL